MEYNELVRDFALRTRKNLVVLRQLQKSQPEVEVYEVTQLINSMLGLLVFPQQEYFTSIPRTPLAKLEIEGWPIPQIIGDYRQARNLNELVRYLRNSVAHFNMKFESNDYKKIVGLEVWNIDPHTGEETWRAKMTIEDIETISDKFIDLLLEM